MALFGPKKRKISRAGALVPTTSPWTRLGEMIRDRGLLLRLSLCISSIICMVAAVEGWKAPFSYRKGYIADHGITAKVDFERVNRIDTDRARAEAKTNVAPVFQHDVAKVDLLSEKLRTSLNDIARANSLDELRPETRAAFGLTRPEGSEEKGADVPDVMNQDFATLKAAISGEDGTAGNRIDDLIVEFKRFIEPIRINGLADANELQRLLSSPERPISVLTPTRPDAPRSVPQANVVLTELVGETGLLGKSWERYPEIALIRDMLERWLLSQAPVTLSYDSSASQQARNDALEQVQNVTFQYGAGDVLVAAGESIDEEALAVLHAEYDQMESMVRTDQRITRTVTIFLLILVLAVMNGYYLIHHEPHLVHSVGRLSLYLSVMIGAVLLARFLSFDPWRAELIPLMATVMILAVAYNQELATLTAFSLTLLISLSTNRDMGQFVVLMSVAATAVIPLASVPSRSKLISVGFWAAIVCFIVTLGTGIVQSQSFTDVLSHPHFLLDALRGAGWCLVAGYLVAGSLPFVESTFGVVTDISLLEMSDISHPLLQELVGRAPGTYNHSISVAAIAESAADRIGANGLLVRIGAYYHDIGKMLKPQYFIENMTEGTESRHEHLAPAMSTLIIIGHVKDGVDLGEQHNLPQQLIDFIEQHHGTTLVEYFYHEATKQADNQPDHRTDAEESSFRYPGPKPQSREAGVLMIADAVESASRTLSEPTAKRIESLVHEITLKRLLDGQFDECSLTLSEIHEVEDSVIKSLIGIYHGRIKYPEQRTA